MSLARCRETTTTGNDSRAKSLPIRSVARVPSSIMMGREGSLESPNNDNHSGRIRCRPTLSARESQRSLFETSSHCSGSFDGEFVVGHGCKHNASKPMRRNSIDLTHDTDSETETTSTHDGVSVSFTSSPKRREAVLQEGPLRKFHRVKQQETSHACISRRERTFPTKTPLQQQREKDDDDDDDFGDVETSSLASLDSPTRGRSLLCSNVLRRLLRRITRELTTSNEAKNTNQQQSDSQQKDNEMLFYPSSILLFHEGTTTYCF